MRAFGIAAGFSAFAMLGAATAQAQVWFEYKPEGGGFRIELPSKPKPMNSGMVMVQIRDAVCVIGQTALDARASSDPQAFLEAATNAIARTNKLRSVERLTIGSAPARRIVSERGARLVGTTLVVVHDGQSIEVTCSEWTPQETKGAIEHLLGSFTLIDR